MSAYPTTDERLAALETENRYNAKKEDLAKLEMSLLLKMTTIMAAVISLALFINRIV